MPVHYLSSNTFIHSAAQAQTLDLTLGPIFHTIFTHSLHKHTLLILPAEHFLKLYPHLFIATFIA